MVLKLEISIIQIHIICSLNGEFVFYASSHHTVHYLAITHHQYASFLLLILLPILLSLHRLSCCSSLESDSSSCNKNLCSYTHGLYRLEPSIRFSNFLWYFLKALLSINDFILFVLFTYQNTFQVIGLKCIEHRYH